MFGSEFFKKNHPTIIGVLSAIAIGAIISSLGNLSGYEAKVLIQQSVDNFNMLCNTITLASATILGLLLSALGTSRSSETNIKKKHYKDIIHVTTVVTSAFIASLFAFLLMLTPITESDRIPPHYYDNFYWLMVIICSMLVGLTITIGLMLRRLIITITKVTALLKNEHELIMDEDDDKDEQLKRDVKEDKMKKDSQ